MENQTESQSFNWFDELPQAPVVITRQSSPSMFTIQQARPSNASVVVVVPAPQEHNQRVPIWVLAFSAIAGASAFVLGAALLSLL
jgi:hypothetical protein